MQMLIEKHYSGSYPTIFLVLHPDPIADPLHSKPFPSCFGSEWITACSLNHNKRSPTFGVQFVILYILNKSPSSIAFALVINGTYRC